jgi:hypothetical protein
MFRNFQHRTRKNCCTPKNRRLLLKCVLLHGFLDIFFRPFLLHDGCSFNQRSWERRTNSFTPSQPSATPAEAAETLQHAGKPDIQFTPIRAWRRGQFVLIRVVSWQMNIRPSQPKKASEVNFPHGGSTLSVLRGTPCGVSCMSSCRMCRFRLRPSAPIHDPRHPVPSHRRALRDSWNVFESRDVHNAISRPDAPRIHNLLLETSR